ncbi:MAG: NTP transferase domain-containing protein [Lachnospiraceae bacterium]|nr:NTP transferase domain-containing protein [Lachnospiraceae bacterium]
MKIVILLAGKGRRIREYLGETHKSMIELNGLPLLWYLIKNIHQAGFDEVVPVVGYQGNSIISYLRREFPMIKFDFVWNRDYEKTNNLVSLVNTEKIVRDSGFIQINGDLIFDYHILKELSCVEGSAIAVDVVNRKEIIDSPKTIMVSDHIMDLGRHIALVDNGGYAIGMYKFSKELAGAFFDLSKKLIVEHPDMGFHDPLRQLYSSCYVKGFDIAEKLWTDIDEKADIKKAIEYLNAMEKNYVEV